MSIPGIPHPAQQGRDRSGDAGFQRDTNVIETDWRAGVRRLITDLKLCEARLSSFVLELEQPPARPTM